MKLPTFLSVAALILATIATQGQIPPDNSQPNISPTAGTIDNKANVTQVIILKNADIVSMVGAGLASPVIIAKMKASEVDFDTSTPALVELTQKGVSQDIITEMIGRPKGAAASSEAANPYMSAYTGAMAQANNMIAAIQHPVTLVADGKSVAIDPLTGRAQAVNAFFKVMVYMVYSGASSSLRIKQRQPEIRVRSNGNPGGHFYLVRVDSQAKAKTRSIKVGSGYFKYESGPDKDWCIEASTKKLNENEWSLIPTGDLKPGEYGVFNGYQLFDFAVDP